MTVVIPLRIAVCTAVGRLCNEQHRLHHVPQVRGVAAGLADLEVIHYRRHRRRRVAEPSV